MASNDIQFLVGKILSDPDFAQALVKNPEKVLQENGIEPSIDLLKALDGVDAESLKNLAAAFGDNQAAL
ncbi:MAG: Os1348 family NHLP clan protein [Anaerolineae bacterium]|nr:Os1348 family NHLP clan protein [Anaerolineae bacterium]